MSPTVAKPRPGERFQNFVALLEKAFAFQDDVSVTSPLRLRDRDTGRLREHDVVITRNTHHGPNLTAIECRDNGRKIGVQAIESYAKKCERTGVHHGIMVASRGFAKTARKKAESLNITCMDLAEAQKFSWVGEITAIAQMLNFTRLSVQLHGADNTPIPKGIAALFDMEGRAIDGERMGHLVMRAVPSSQLAAIDGSERTGSVACPIPGAYAIDLAGARWPIDAMTIFYGVVAETLTQRISLHRYGSETTAEIASTQVTFSNGQTSDLAFVKSERGVTAILRSTGTHAHSVQIGDAPQRFFEASTTPIAPQKKHAP